MVIIFLIILDFFWSGAAWVYDADKLITIPLHLWLFVAVCPVYPLLLALLLLQLYLKKPLNQFLLAFAVIPSIVFGFSALLFYPIAMIYQGFSWNAVGQIFWVWAYAGQGVWLFTKYKINKLPFLLSSLFIGFILFFEFITGSFGYFDFAKIPLGVLYLLLFFGIFSIFFLFIKRRID
jgi:hypothetical protein